MLNRSFLAGSLLVVLLLIAGCEANQLVDENYTEVVPPGEDGRERPEIPRTDPPDVERLYPEPSHRYPAELRQFLTVQSRTRASEQGIIVGDYEEPFLIGMKIEELIPGLGRGSMEMLTPQLVIADNGATFEVESFLRFDFEENSTGELKYEVDPDSEVLEPYLFFEEEKPMFEYAYLLQEGAFPLLIGARVDFFGDDYIIHEAYNESLTLYGANVDQYLRLANGSAMSINGDTIAGTEVQVNPWGVIITYVTPYVDEDGIRVKAGEGVREKLQRPEILLHPLFDIRFDGFETSTEDQIRFKQRGDRIRVTFTNILREEIAVDLLSRDSSGALNWGSDEHPLHFKECDRSEYCIKQDDRFILTTREGVTKILEMRSASRTRLMLRELGTDETHEVKIVDTGRVDVINGTNVSRYEGMLDFGAGLHDVEVLLEEGRERIRIDMDGDGGIGSDELSIFTPFTEIELNEMKEIILRQPALNDIDEEEIIVSVTDSFLLSSNVTVEQVDDEDSYQGVTSRGAIVTLDETTDGISGEELIVSFPPAFRPGLVRILG
jgi:hypothetical protein